MFVEKSIKEFSEFFQNFFVVEVIGDGFLQRVDARLKIFGLVLLVLATVSTFDFRKLAVLAGILVLLVVTSRIPLRVYLARIWFIPTFSFFVTLPHGFWGEHAVIQMGFVSLTDGVYYILTFSFRVFLAVSFLSLILLTTNFSDIIGALRFYRIPESFISILAITYRYIHFFFLELYRILVAWESRRLRDFNAKDVWKHGGRMLGAFFIRAYEKGERVYMASVARGYDGCIRVYQNESRLGFVDFAFVAIIALGLVVFLN